MILKNTKATSIIESVIVIFIMTTGILGMFKVYNTSVKLSETTANRITAIQIAREGIEAMETIRGTNWILYSSDYPNCWNTLNYAVGCVNNSTLTNDIPESSFIIKSDINNRWLLSQTTSLGSDFTNSIYRNNFKVKKDNNGFYTQSGGTDFLPIFTREIKVEYFEDTNGDLAFDSNDEKMKIISLVQWVDSSSKIPHKVKLETILTNWKK